MTTDKNQESGEFDRINIKKLKTVLPRSRRRYWNTFAIYLNSLFCTVQSLIISLRYKPDVIYAHDYTLAVAAFIASRITKSKYILKRYGIGKSFMVPGIIDSKYAPKQYGVDKLNYIRRMLSYLPSKLPADAYIITNDGTFGDAAAEFYGIPPHKLCFWTNGISKNWADSSIDHTLRKELAPSNEKLVLSLCRLTGSKQVDVLIKAIPKVVEKYGAVRFVVVGDGGERAYLENLVRNLGVSDFARFEGAVLHEKALEYMRICDVFVSMNDLSSICNPVLEAMTCGKPVIALNTGATSDLIEHNHNGILVNVDEVDRLPNTILSLLTNDNLAERIGKNAQTFMLDNWPTWEERINLEADLVEALCSDDSESIAAAKKEADAVLNLGIRLSK